MHIRVNDIVEVHTGDDRGTGANPTRAKVLTVDHAAGKLVVEGINRVYKHVKRSQKNPQGGRLSKEMPIQISNVLLVCRSCGKATRTGARLANDGSKERFCKKCGSVAVARERAAAVGLAQARFAVGDIDTLDYQAAAFDAVVSVFGVFFAADMAGLLRRAWSWLAPGGRLAVTVWGETVLAPGEALFWDAVRREDPALDHISPAGRVTTPEALRRLFAEAGLPPPEVTVERWSMPLASREAFWPVILGTSNRGAWDALAVDAQDRVRRFVEETLASDRVEALASEAVVAVVGAS